MFLYTVRRPMVSCQSFDVKTGTSSGGTMAVLSSFFIFLLQWLGYILGIASSVVLQFLSLRIFLSVCSDSDSERFYSHCVKHIGICPRVCVLVLTCNSFFFHTNINDQYCTVTDDPKTNNNNNNNNDNGDNNNNHPNVTVCFTIVGPSSSSLPETFRMC